MNFCGIKNGSMSLELHTLRQQKCSKCWDPGFLSCSSDATWALNGFLCFLKISSKGHDQPLKILLLCVCGFVFHSPLFKLIIVLKSPLFGCCCFLEQLIVQCQKEMSSASIAGRTLSAYLYVNISLIIKKMKRGKKKGANLKSGIMTCFAAVFP